MIYMKDVFTVLSCPNEMHIKSMVWEMCQWKMRLAKVAMSLPYVFVQSKHYTLWWMKPALDLVRYFLVGKGSNFMPPGSWNLRIFIESKET